ncbi:MAG: 4Fe-4S dicluster domain-containing protein [Verrucomicrobiae bacterium]|nr:4Fe-4S dicluster domain-containing protein [Verrucomicrobiae bacterium]
MRARIVDKNDILKIVDILRKDHEVIAPFQGRGRDSFFDVVTDANRDQVKMHLHNPYYPPKRYVLPHIEKLFDIDQAKMDVKAAYVEPKRAIFGIRSCDVHGIYHLDRFYLGRDYKDPYYERLRRGLFLVNVVCTDKELDIDNGCFCMCANTGPASTEHFDLQLMDLGDVYMAVAGSPKGEALFADPIFKRGDDSHVQRRRSILNEVRKHFKLAVNWYSAAVRYITTGQVPEELWAQVGNRCLECGACTYLCPACTCFTVADRKVDGKVVERVRLWDSCALSGFTRMAGGHNPRRAVHDRRNRRFFRKLAHYFVQRELSMACVGCGRCIDVCHGDIGMPSVVEIIRRGCAGKENDSTIIKR